MQRVDPDQPDFHILTTVSKLGGFPIPLLASACASLDSQFPVAESKNFTDSCRRVKVSVSWNPYTPGRTYSLVSLIDEPVFVWRGINPIEVTAGSLGPLAHNATITLTAQAFDSTNGAIPDLIYHWYVQPGSIPTTATVTSDPAGTNPYGILRVYSTGVYGPSNKPIAQHKIYAEIDAAPLLRDFSGNPNPNLFKIVNFQDLGSP